MKKDGSVPRASLPNASEALEGIGSSHSSDPTGHQGRSKTFAQVVHDGVNPKEGSTAFLWHCVQQDSLGIATWVRMDQKGVWGAGWSKNKHTRNEKLQEQKRKIKEAHSGKDMQRPRLKRV